MDVNKYRILIKRDGTREVQFINNEMIFWQRCELPEVHEEKKKVKKFGYQVIYRGLNGVCASQKIYKNEEEARELFYGAKFIALGPKIEWEEDEK